ncbi:MAG TPA: hypothetical protein DD670_05190, partial [Planctomycetaceae bacterium]|nr:hypothetical protein [Planctomycetaceae bacterium]
MKQRREEEKGRVKGELHDELPEVKGFSEHNIKRTVQFAREYPSAFLTVPRIGQPVVAQLPGPQVSIPKLKETHAATQRDFKAFAESIAQARVVCHARGSPAVYKAQARNAREDGRGTLPRLRFGL